MSSQESLIGGRYQPLECLGAGGMGEVWKARDHVFDDRLVAIKLLKEDETSRAEAASREKLLRLVRDEATNDRLSVRMAVSLLDDVLHCGKGRRALHERVEAAAGAQGELSVREVIELFDAALPDPEVSESARERAKLRRLFRAEANSVANLRHDNIASISHYGDHEGSPFLVMDFIDGLTLKRVIQRGDPVPRIRQLKWMESLCDGLAYAHRRGLVHRDVKPANLIIERETDSLKILDFGVVRRLQEESHSITGVPVGTYCYMSPEQTRGVPADRRSDVFAVGAVFYELLSGEKAFPGTEGTEIMRRIQSEEPIPLRQLVPDLEQDCVVIIGRAMDKAIDRRYQDLGDMKRDIERLRAKLDHQERTIVVDGGIPRLMMEGAIALEADDDRVAADRARQVLEIDSTHEAAHQLLADAGVLADRRRIRGLLAKAEAALQAGQLEEARQGWTTASLTAASWPDVIEFGTRLTEAETARRIAEAEAARLAAEAEAARRREEEEKARLAKEAEAAKQREAARLAEEAEARRRVNEERARQAKEAEVARQREAVRLAAEAEAARLAKEAEAARQREAARLAEAEATRRRGEEERARQAQQAEAAKREPQETERRVAQEANDEVRTEKRPKGLVPIVLVILQLLAVTGYFVYRYFASRAGY